MTNRENINSTNIADFMQMINQNIPFKCIIECLDGVYAAMVCNNEPHCLQCINNWLNCEVKKHE